MLTLADVSRVIAELAVGSNQTPGNGEPPPRTPDIDVSVVKDNNIFSLDFQPNGDEGLYTDPYI